MRPRRWVAVVPIAGLVIAIGCQSPDEFFRYSDANQMGTGGSADTGTAGTTGAGGTAAGGTGGGPTGVAGAGGSTAGTGNTIGTAGSTGTAGSGTGTGGTAAPAGTGGSAGANSGRGGAAGTTTGGASGAVGSAGATGAGGSTGTAGGRGGTSGTAGAGGGAGNSGGRGGASGSLGTGGGAAGTTGAGGGDAGTTAGHIEVVAQCQGTNGMQDIRVTFKVFNPESVTKQLSDIKVRYYFTLAMPAAPMVTIDYSQKVPQNMITSSTTTSYAEIGFATGSGTIAGFDNVTGTDQIQLHLYNYSSPTWNATQTDDYSYKSCAGVTDTSAYADRTTMPGYYQGQLAWGAEPPQ